MVRREIKLYSTRFVRSCDRHSPQAIKAQLALASLTTTTKGLMSSSWCTWHFFDLACSNMVLYWLCARVGHAQVTVTTDHVPIAREGHRR